jgi:DNA (cytosine-5)-methyltransferase 1
MPSVRSPQRALVPVIDLFAGPGGLGEGFCAFTHERLGFDVVLSVEKDAAAHSTLLLRSFYRSLLAHEDLSRYYEYVKGGISRDQLFEAYPRLASEARDRCLHLELGPRTTPRAYDHLERAISHAEHWVLVGGPPCQAYSVVGRSRLTRLNREEFEDNEKHVLYREYLRILAGYLPSVFVMENVKGLLSATYGGDSTFARIISDLSSPTVAVRESVNGRKPGVRRSAKYVIRSFVHPGNDAEGLQPSHYVIESEKFGIPQRRHRVILLGVRDDLNVPSGLCLKPRLAPSVRSVLSDLPAVRSQLSHGDSGPESWARAIREKYAAFDGAGVEDEVRKVMNAALRCLRVTAGVGGRSVSRTGTLPSSDLTRWLLDPALGVIPNHETRRHIPEDLVRYLFAASYGSVHGASPKLHSFPPGLLPNHQNVPDTIKLRHGYFNDRFRVQVADQPATTVMSHIAKDGHYFIHHDPMQCRSWTVREAARVQTFPDNYFFEGFRTDQYRQVGNAVPPFLALQIAGLVARVLGAT